MKGGNTRTRNVYIINKVIYNENLKKKENTLLSVFLADFSGLSFWDFFFVCKARFQTILDKASTDTNRIPSLFIIWLGREAVRVCGDEERPDREELPAHQLHW